MKRTCARPTCALAATVTLSYSYADRTVVLEDLSGDAHPMVHDLCPRHAEACSVPQGWSMDDRRTPRVDVVGSDISSGLGAHRLSA